MSQIDITAYSPDRKREVLALTIDAWTPVFEKTRHAVPGFVYDAFYPEGWQVRQEADVATLLEQEPEAFWLAHAGASLAGYIAIRVHPEDRMGEIHIIAVSPDHQRQGVALALMSFAERKVAAAGMTMMMVETIDDPGHAPARAAYEATGYERWPVARYFKRLD